MGDRNGFDSRRIRDHTKELITKKLLEVSGPKDLVLDPDLMTPLDRIIEPSALKSTGVDKIFKMEKPIGPMRGSKKRVYIIRNKASVVRVVCAQVTIDLEMGVLCEYHLFMVPRLTYQCELVLEEEGVHGHMVTSNLPFLLVPLDRHLISMECKLFYRSLFLDGDQSLIHDTASSLVLLQQLYGKFQEVFMVGHCAQKSYELMTYMMEKSSSSPSSSSSSCFNSPDHISQVIIIDRSCDLVTPLCSQLTYEGLLDEIFQIDCGFITLGPEVTSLQKPTKIFLNNEDLIFQEIRDRHFSNVATFLNAKARELQTGYKKTKGLNIAGAKEFVKNDLKDLMAKRNSLSTHVGACDFITTKKVHLEITKQLEMEHSLLNGVDIKNCCVYIEELINRQVDLYTSLSLLCLLSLTEGGLSATLHKSLCTQFLQSYGYEHLIGWNNLKRLSMIFEKSQMLSASSIMKKVMPSQASFRSISKRLNLIPPLASEVNLFNPKDLSYVFSGAFIPLLCRIVEQIISGVEMTSVEETMKLLDVPFSSKIDIQSAKHSLIHPKVIMVFFLGGTTLSEISALKLLGKNKGCQIVSCTTSIINNKSFLKPLFS